MRVGCYETANYDYDFQVGEPLVVLDDTGAEQYLRYGQIVHFLRYGNKSTIHLQETHGLIGKVGFDPTRFSIPRECP